MLLNAMIKNSSITRKPLGKCVDEKQCTCQMVWRKAATETATAGFELWPHWSGLWRSQPELIYYKNHMSQQGHYRTVYGCNVIGWDKENSWEGGQHKTGCGWYTSLPTWITLLYALIHMCSSNCILTKNSCNAKKTKNLVDLWIKTRGTCFIQFWWWNETSLTFHYEIFRAVSSSKWGRSAVYTYMYTYIRSQHVFKMACWNITLTHP